MKIKVILIEDEAAAAKHLLGIIKNFLPHLEVLATLSSNSASKDWFRQNELPDLIFMDIHLSDGNSFELLEQVTIDCPIIYTTAYDQYAIKAFKTTGIDYLLKPIAENEVLTAVAKYSQLKSQATEDWWLKNLELYHQLKSDQPINYKKHFLLKNGNHLTPVTAEEIAYFYRTDFVFARLFDGQSFLMDDSLELLQQKLDPGQFIRLQRKLLVNIKSIQSLKKYKPGRLTVVLDPMFSEEINLSQERSSWLKKFYK